MSRFMTLVIAASLVLGTALAGSTTTLSDPGERRRLHARCATGVEAGDEAAGAEAAEEVAEVEGAQRAVLQRPAPQGGSFPDRAQGRRHDQAHAQGVLHPDRRLLVRPEERRVGDRRGPPAWREGADASQRPLGHRGDEDDPQRDRHRPVGEELHLQVQDELPQRGERVQQPALQVLPLQPGRQVQGRDRHRLGQHDAQRRHPPVERPLLHVRRARDLPASSWASSTT